MINKIEKDLLIKILFGFISIIFLIISIYLISMILYYIQSKNTEMLKILFNDSSFYFIFLGCIILSVIFYWYSIINTLIKEAFEKTKAKEIIENKISETTKNLILDIDKIKIDLEKELENVKELKNQIKETEIAINDIKNNDEGIEDDIASKEDNISSSEIDFISQIRNNYKPDNLINWFDRKNNNGGCTNKILQIKRGNIDRQIVNFSIRKDGYKIYLRFNDLDVEKLNDFQDKYVNFKDNKIFQLIDKYNYYKTSKDYGDGTFEWGVLDLKINNNILSFSKHSKKGESDKNNKTLEFKIDNNEWLKEIGEIINIVIEKNKP